MMLYAGKQIVSCQPPKQDITVADALKPFDAYIFGLAILS